MLTFYKSEVARFHHSNKSLRYGQAFYQFFKLWEVTSADKHFCDKLYIVDDEVAKAMIASRTDQTQ